MANQAALDRHHASEMMQQIAKLREKYDLHMQVKRYILDRSAAKDADYIRK